MEPRIPLVLFNSLGRQLQEFVPQSPGTARIYNCGPTVYNYVHIGNLRAYLLPDTLKRVLQWKGYDVFHVMNITDVGHLTSDADEGEDKMEQAAQKNKKSVWEIAEYYTQQFQHDIQAINIEFPSAFTKATDHIQEMINFAMVCEQRGYAYLLEDGLYFDTSKLKDYGTLALLDIAGQETGTRVSLISSKRNQSDFALWRKSPSSVKRLMEWDSPWGVGAPGWHLECSAMSVKYLGSKFDIHTGGVDLRQVHHCNEIAQNQAYLGDGSSGAKFWLHNEFVNMAQQKMSKSTGQFIRLQTIIDAGIHPMAYRYFCLMATYRSLLEFTLDNIMAARAGFSRLLKRIELLKKQSSDLTWMNVLSDAKYSMGGSYTFLRQRIESQIPGNYQDYIAKFDAAISDDLNTPQALALLSNLASDTTVPADAALRLIASFDMVLGLKLLELIPEDLNMRPVYAAIEETEISKLLEQRQAARKNRDFKTADEIRTKLTEQGIAIMDSDDTTAWEWIPKY